MKNKALNQITVKMFFALLICVYLYLVFWLTGLYFEEHTVLGPLRFATNAYLFEPLALLLTYIVVLVVLCRIITSLLLVTLSYIVFMSINSQMVEILGLILSPIDFKHGFQVILAKEFLFSYWMSILIFLLAFAGLIVLVFKTKPTPLIKKHQRIAVLVLLPLVLFIGLNHYSVSLFFKKNFKMQGQAVPQTFAEYHGYLFSFYYQVLKKRQIRTPENYSEQQINKLVVQYDQNSYQSIGPKPHVIIFFIEAFADPNQMGIKTSYDPIPNFRKYAQESLSGLVISPELGGRSANPEFELLTGLSMRNVPEKSIPYIDFINRPYPSLAKEFNNNGYESTALHVAHLSFFNYEKAYEFLGFDQVDTLVNRKGVEKDPVNRFPSENALVDEIIQITEQAEKPQFIFSFPNSTHGRWDYDTYLGSDLDVYGEYLDGGTKHLKTYVNAINQADQAIGKLIGYFEQKQSPVIIMVLGDHQPGLPEFREKITLDLLNKKYPGIVINSRRQLKQAIRTKALKSSYAFYKQNHQVPYLIWSNYQSSFKNVNTSMNFLSVLLLEVAKIQKTPLYQLLSELQKEVNELSIMTPLQDENQELIKNYEFLQYDIMSGENYYMKR